MRVPPLEITAAAKKSQVATRLWGSVQLAQWAIESGWGEHEPPGSNNPFGIKAVLNNHGKPMGPAVRASTHETVLGVSIPTKAWFAQYPSIDLAFVAHAKLITEGFWFKGAMEVIDNYVAFITLMAAHYATDKKYAEKLIDVINQNQFRQYDI